jgi:hypothetical protein
VKAEHPMLTYLLGPILALLPQRWRQRLSRLKINWARATTISGFVELVAGLVLFWKWYFVTMNLWINRGWNVALQNPSGPEITDHTVGGAALLIWASHPVTWLLAYFCIEGAVRFLGAAFSNSIMGTLPLFLVSKIIGIFSRDPQAQEEGPGVASSFFSAINEKLLERSQPECPDELMATKSGPHEFLEIRASRRKPDWDPPRTVRIHDTYYRLETFTKGAPPRPFRYTLRKLTAGVPSRTVLLYAPENALVTEKT